MEDPTVVASVTVRVTNTGLGRNYDVILGSTFDLRTEKWLAENTCVDWLREVLLDTKKPELELHAAQLDDCTIGMEVLRRPLSVRSANGILLTREGGDVAASDATVFVTKKWSALNFLRQVGTDSTTTLRYTLTPPEPAARTGRQPISVAPEGPTVHESLMLNHARLKTHLPSKVAHKRMYGNHSMFNNLVDLFAAHGVGFSKDVVEGTPRDMLTKLTDGFFNCCAETAVQLRDVKNAKRPFPDPMFDPFFRFNSFDQLGSHQKVVTNYDKANTSFIAAEGIMNHIMKMHTAWEPFLSKWLVFFASFRHYYLRISRQRAREADGLVERSVVVLCQWYRPSSRGRQLISITVIIMPEGVSARAPRIPLPPVFSGQTKGWRRWRHQMEAYCNATGMKQAMMMSEHASSDQHFKLYATLTALLPEELLDVIRRHLNDNATSGGQAWAALRTRFEGGHLGRISDMYAVLQSGQQRTETAEAYYHRLDNAFLDLVAEAEEHEDVEAPSHNQVVTQFLAGLRPEYEPIIGILQVTAEHEGRAITWEGDCLKLAQNYSKRIEKNHASEPSAEGYIASGGTKRSAHLATGDGSGPRRLGAPLRGGCWQCGGPHFKRDCPQRPRGNRRQAAADPAPAAFVADEEEEHVAFMAENAGNTPPAKRVALSLLDDEWDDWAPEPGTLLYDLFGGEYESEEDVRPAEAARAVAQANEREHDLDSHNMDEIISLSGLSDCFGMSDDEAGSASGGTGGSARVVTKSDSAYLLDAVALAGVVVDARGACMLGLNDDLGSYPDMWVKDSGAYPHMVADSDSFVEYEQLAPPVEKFGADIWGPVGVTSIGGFRYVFGMTDYYSAYGWVVFMKSKDEAPRALLLVNGLQERMWLTLSEMTVAMLLHAGLGREFWALAFCAAMHIRNNVYSRGVGSVPYRRHTGKTPDVAGLRVFGCPAYVHVDAGNRRKLDAKAFRGVFVGYGQESHTYLVWNPATRRVVASRNVIFDEGWRDAASSSKGGSGGDAAASLEMFPQYQALLDNSGVGSTSDASRLQEITEAHQRVVDETDDVEEELEIEEEPLTAEELELGPQQPTLDLTQLETNEGTDDGGQEEPLVQRAERDPYPARSRRAPGQWWVVHPENPNDDAAAMMAAAFAAVTQGVDEPITLKQALSGPFKEQWAQAVESEFNSLEKQGTWVVCELPEERTAIPSKWVFKVKYNADGSIARFKARLVVQGCRQRHGIDYAETFAPTVKFTTIRVLFAIAVQYGWNIHQVDVDTAFLYAPVEEEIYMRPPPGYEQYDARGRPMVLRLLKSLYGLKQSPRNWHNTLHKFLVCYGFQQLKSDPGAYVYWQGGQLICILVVYVDDMIFAFKDAVWAADFKTALGARFDIKDLGVCAWALGMAVERDWDNATLKVHQAKYIDDMVHKFNLADAYAVSTPAEVGADVPGSNKPLAAEMPYQALVGSLLYAMVATRPDIAEAVSKLCRVMAKPEERHWQAAKRVLRYLKGTKTLGLTFSGGKADGLLHGYCDADWAGDVVSRRSTTGFVFMLCGAAVSWKSQLQATVALSTAEAEYMALCAAVCEALFLRELLRELCCAQSEATVIFEDNQSCIALTRNPMTHGRSKHIAIKYHFTREKVLSGEVAIEYCPTAQMVADALTKALGRLKHAEFAMQMLGA
eukprot:jgi/Tetstr1/446837/TSEL_034316.t1